MIIVATRAGLCVLLLLSTLSAIQSIRNALEYSVDLQWHEGRLIALGINPYAPGLSTEEIGRLVGDFGSDGAVQLPSVLFLFTPLAAFDLNTAKLVWLILNFIATPCIVIFFLKNFHADQLNFKYFTIVLLLFIASSPWRHTIGNGQHGLIGLGLFLLSYSFFKNRKPAFSILFLSLSMIKYTLIIPFCALFLQDWRRGSIIVLGAISLHISLTLFVGFQVDENPITLVVQSISLASNLKSEGWIDIFSIYYNVFPDSSDIFWPLALAFCVALLATFLCVRVVDSRSASLIAIVSLILVYHRVYDALVLIALLVHLINLVAPVQFSELSTWRTRLEQIEFIAGSILIAWAFFLNKLIYELAKRDWISTGLEHNFNIVFSILLYSYLVFLMIRVTQSGGIRSSRGLGPSA